MDSPAKGVLGVFASYWPFIGVAFAVIVEQTAGRPPKKLREPTGIVDDQFTNVTGLRELADSRVIITDGRENRVVVADFAKGTAEPVGRVGQGPGEFSSVASVMAMGGDSSLLPDLNARRWLVMVGSRIVATLGPERTGVGLAFAIAEGAFFGGAKDGRLLMRIPMPYRSGTFEIGASDSTALITISRSTGRIDSVTRVRVAPRRQTVKMGRDGNLSDVSITVPAWSVGEEAMMCSDGWVAVARLDPYRVDWFAPNGTVTRGTPLPVELVKVDALERIKYMARLAYGTGRRPRSPNTIAEWPEHIPPVQAPWSLSCIPDGRIAIRRNSSRKDGGRYFYDIVDRGGRLSERIGLADHERILAFGSRSVYIVSTDSDRVQTVRRHPWP